MDQKLKYNGFLGSVKIDVAENILHGKILHIDDLVTYESASPEGLQQEFEAAVEDYLATCKQLGISPQKSMSGSFNIRMTPDLHRDLAIHAEEDGATLNKFTINMIRGGLLVYRRNQHLPNIVYHAGTEGRMHFINWDPRAVTSGAVAVDWQSLGQSNFTEPSSIDDHFVSIPRNN